MSKDKNFEQCLTALKVIHTWATFRNGECLVPDQVAKLCEKSLKPYRNEQKGLYNGKQNG